MVYRMKKARTNNIAYSLFLLHFLRMETLTKGCY